MGPGRVTGSRVAVAVVAAGLAGLVAPGPAAAHSVLLGTAPAEGSVVTAVTTEVTLTFNEPVRAQFSTVAVTGPGGRAYATGELTVRDNVARQPVHPLRSGDYQVAWRVVSLDGHPVSGTFTFRVSLRVPVGRGRRRRRAEPRETVVVGPDRGGVGRGGPAADPRRPSAGPMTAASTQDAEPTSPPARAGIGSLWWLGAAVVAVAVLLLAAGFGGALSGDRLVGLPDPGPVTGIALVVLRLLGDAAAAVTVGGTVFAAFVLPGLDRTVGPAGYRLLRLAGLVAGVWALTALASLVATTSDLLGRPLSATSPRAVLSVAVSVSQGQALLWQIGLAIAVAVLGRVAISRTAAAFAAVIALLAVVPPALTGHAAGAGNHQLAVSSLVVHVLAAALWAGGLVALLLVRPRRLIVDAATAFSRVALVCFVAVAVSGAANAAVRLGGIGALISSGYGLLVLGKVGALAGLGVFGLAHRRWSLRRLAAGGRGAFAQLAGGEVILLAATFGVAAALSRTPTPVAADPDGYDPVAELLGFPMPAPLTMARLLGSPLPELLILTVIVAAAAAYLAGVRRMRQAGHPWPWVRTVCWLAGLAVLGVVTNLGVARYAYVLFSVHMAQHMVLSMVVPFLLVAGAPVTLALRTLRDPADSGVRSPRQWLLAVLHSRVARFYTHPVVALVIYVVGLYGLYFTDLFSALMRSHTGHLAMIVHFVLSGYLLTWVLVGIDPGRRRVPPPIRLLVLFAAMVFHAFFGVAMMQSAEIIGGAWYDAVHPAWAGTPTADQTMAAGIAWAFGEIPSAVVAILLVRQWMREDEREQRRLDRAAERAERAGEEDADDELTRYNAFLQRINAEARGEGEVPR
jgi:cytochrome c oxidase assembly factor CtaG/methionine-rich copper-binding protein CopC